MSGIQTISDSSYDKLVGALSTPAVIFFYAPWSKPCRPTQETLVDLAKVYDEKVSFFCMDIDENANIPASLGVTKIPSIYAIHEGRITDKLSGRNPRVKIREFIESQCHGSTIPR